MRARLPVEICRRSLGGDQPASAAETRTDTPSGGEHAARRHDRAAAAELRLIGVVGAVVLADVGIGLPTLLWLGGAAPGDTVAHRPSQYAARVSSEDPNDHRPHA